MAATMLVVLGCAEEETEPEVVCPRGFDQTWDVPSIEDCELDPIALGELVVSIDAGGTYLRAVNREPFMQQHGPPKVRSVYGSTQAIADVPGVELSPIDLYRTIDPDDLEATFDHELPIGAIFVHYAVVDGPPYGAMVKLPEGSDPDNNDWFFGRFDEYGYPAPLESYDGQTCRDCHVLDDRPARTDMLWGVPRASL